jgi:hypothetical protein
LELDLGLMGSGRIILGEKRERERERESGNSHTHGEESH